MRIETGFGKYMRNGKIVDVPQIYCYKCYDQKEILKGLGYRWDRSQKYWFKNTTVETLGNDVVDIMVNCNLDPDVIASYFDQITYSELARYNVYLDEEHKEKVAKFFGRN